MNEFLDIFSDVLRIATFQPGSRERYHHAFTPPIEMEVGRPRRSLPGYLGTRARNAGRI